MTATRSSGGGTSAAAASAPPIGGHTRLYAVLGDPVTQVRAPGLLNPLFRDLGTPAVLVPVHVSAADLPTALDGLRRVRNLDGLLVTVPHKIAVRHLVDGVSTTVALTGSANAVRREPDGGWFADNFDGSGFVAGLTAAGHQVAGRTVTLIGAGGAGSAIAVALLGAGVRRLWLHDADDRRVTDLLRRLDGPWPHLAVGTPRARLHDADIAVNATSLGLRPGDPLPFDPAELPPGRVVADIVMEPRETALLRAAARCGHRVHHGLHMLEHQIAAYRAFFRLG